MMIKKGTQGLSWSLLVAFMMMAFQTTAQKKITLEMSYAVGDKEKIEISIDQEISTNMSGMAMTINNTIQMWMDQECVAITEEGYFKLEQTISRATMNMMMMGQEIAVDTDE